jgi:AraC family transcriptional regulator
MDRIARARHYLERHLDDEVSLETLAAEACFSPYHFHRVFRGMTGESVMAQRRRLLLERAGRRLRSGDARILDIAVEAGYDSHEAFTRAFKSVFGVAPAAYRDEAAARPAPPEPPEGARLTELGPIRCLACRHTGAYDGVGAAWSRLFTLARDFGEMFGILHDDPEVTPPERLRYDAAMRTARDSAPEGLALLEIPEGLYATVRHTGPYSALGDSYARLCGGWIPGRGREIAPLPSLEFYRNDPRSAPPELLVTDIFVPLET